jgi:ketosteroid isomerase-like protein
VTEREGSIEAVVRSFFETLSSGDLDGVGKLLHEQATWSIFAEGLPGAGTHEGRDAIVEGFLRPVRGMFEPGDPKVVIENLVADGSWVAVEARGRGRFANGTPYRNTYAFFVEVDDGKVRTVREYMDSQLASTLVALSQESDARMRGV